MEISKAYNKLYSSRTKDIDKNLRNFIKSKHKNKFN